MRCLPGADPFPAELEQRLTTAVAARPGAKPRTRHVEPDGGPRFTNRLALAGSPYLLQHAHNPVNWYPWGDEAFAEARRLGRPVFLSIGYSTCHWCHVMEEESFEDETIAAVLNRHYVAIKVDREERPDIDAVYMRAAQRLTGSGGWPLSLWLTPAREPFFAGTYFPPRAGARGAEVGLFEILTELVGLYDSDGSRVEEAAKSLTQIVRVELESRLQAPRSDFAGTSPASPRRLEGLVKAAVEECRLGYDERNGGLRLPQKFPSHVPVRLLLRHHQRSGDADALHMAVHTLESMAKGGIYDHLAGGFHRYATDREWLVPHFEKMLYDNALLVVAYAEAWQVTKRPDFARVVRQSCDELLRTFAAPSGGFYSATDADSEGVEGKFFVWSADEIRALLGDGEDTELFLEHYGVTPGGNCELGNVLHVRTVDEDMVRRLAPARAKLARARGLRTPPLRDDKILAAWNGLAVSAFAIAGRVFDEPRYLAAAVSAADFALGPMTLATSQGGRLARSYCAGQIGAAGFLDDYAFVAAGLLDLFESTHEPRWFFTAQRLCDEIEQQFADHETGAWFMTGRDHEHLLARERPVHDGAEPAGSSVALGNAVRLATFTDDERWRGIVERALGYYLPGMEAQPMGMAHALLAVDFLAGPIHEVVLALPASDRSNALEDVLRTSFCPRHVLLAGQPGSSNWQALERHIPLLADKLAQDGRATAYVCQQGRCDLPTTDPARLAQQIAG